MKKFILVSALMLNVVFVWGQILTFDFAGLAGSEMSANSNLNNGSISSSTITRGAGLTASGNADRFNATNWALTTIANAISGNKYMEFTISPNSGCDFSISSIVIQVQRSATGPSQVALRSSEDAFASNLGGVQTITDNTSTQTFTFTFTQSNISTPTTYRFYMFAEAAGGSGGIGDGTGNDLIVNGTTSCGSPTTITTGLVSGGPFAVNCSTSDAGSVAFTSSGTFAVGNIFTAQLSNAAGSFASPTTIGTLTGASAEGLNPSGSVSFTIPSATATGSGYLIRVISSNPSVTGSNSASNTITLTGAPCTLTPIHVTSLLYDGCDVSCGAGAEGKSEIMFGTTGDYSMTPNATNVVLNYTTGSSIMTSTVTNNSATTSALNAAAGCPGLFVDAFGSTLSPNSSFLVVSENLCVSALTWSNLCGTGPIYVIYGGATGSGTNFWHDGGNFGNSGNNNKNFTMTFTATDGTVFNQNYSYLAPSSATNGNYAKWNLNAGTPIEQGNMPNCDITPIALPSELIYFKGIADRNSILLNWETASEKNNDYFTLAHSIDGYNFITIGNVNGRGNTTETSDYSFEHLQPSTGVNYYKLTSTDYDGKRYNKGIIAVSVDVNSIYYNSITQTIELPKKSIIDIYTVDGKHLMQSDNETSIPFTHSGIFLIVDRLTGTTERIFIPVLQ